MNVRRLAAYGLATIAAVAALATTATPAVAAPPASERCTGTNNTVVPIPHNTYEAASTTIVLSGCNRRPSTATVTVRFQWEWSEALTISMNPPEGGQAHGSYFMRSGTASGQRTPDPLELTYTVDVSKSPNANGPWRLSLYDGIWPTITPEGTLDGWSITIN